MKLFLVVVLVLGLLGALWYGLLGREVSGEGLRPPDAGATQLPASLESSMESPGGAAAGLADREVVETPRVDGESKADFRIEGRVLDDLDQRWGQGRVEILDLGGALVASVSVGSLGTFEVAVEPGIYEVGVSGQTLPEGFAPPIETRVLRARAQSKFERQVVEVTEAEPVQDVILYVFKSAIIFGQIVDELGEPIEGAYVYLDYAGVDYVPPQGRGEDRTDEGGNFEIVQAYPGNYRLFVAALEPDGDDDELRTPPAPVEIEVACGGVYPVGVLHTGGDGVILKGRIVNQDGEPFVGDEIECMPYGEARPGWQGYKLGWHVARTHTGPDGVFVFDSLPARYLRVDLAADWDEDDGTRRVARWWKPYYVDLRGKAAGAVVDMGTEFIPESRPYSMDIHFEVDPEWLERHGIGLADAEDLFTAKTRLLEPGPPFAGLSIEDRYAAYGGGGGSRFDDETLTLHYYSEPPLTPKTLRVIVESRGSRPRFEDFERTFLPFQGGSEQMTIHIPPRD